MKGFFMQMLPLLQALFISALFISDRREIPKAAGKTEKCLLNGQHKNANPLFLHKKSRTPHRRQSGCLPFVWSKTVNEKTRDFPSQFCNWFGFYYIYHNRKAESVKRFFQHRFFQCSIIEDLKKIFSGPGILLISREVLDDRNHELGDPEAELSHIGVVQHDAIRH